MLGLLRKIETWWIVNVEIPANAELDGVEIDEAVINPGSVLDMRILMDVALGDDGTSRLYYSELQRLVARKRLWEQVLWRMME